MSTAAPTKHEPERRTWRQRFIVEERYVAPAARKRLYTVEYSKIQTDGT